ncbi:tyrosine-protein phosphatase (plasmid) [Aggregatilineales bacterium SYSU G02658]
MNVLLRTVVIGGALLGVWRLIVRLQKRPDYPPAASFVTRLDDENRLLGFETVANLRDIGGYRTAHGQRVRRGLVFRGASLAYINEAEAAKLSEMGLRLVCDLRTPEEIAAAPDHVPAGARYWHLPMLQLDNRWREAARMVLIPNYLDTMTRQIYIQMVDNQRQSLAALYREWMQPENLPALVHCSAGKDRTGVAVALLLLVLGVPEEVVLADYSHTNDFYDYIKTLSTDLIAGLKRLGLRQEDITALLIADPANLAATLRHIDAAYGGVEGYFRTALGFNDADLAALRATFLEAG